MRLLSERYREQFVEDNRQVPVLERDGLVDDYVSHLDELSEYYELTPAEELEVMSELCRMLREVIAENTAFAEAKAHNCVECGRYPRDLPSDFCAACKAGKMT